MGLSSAGEVVGLNAILAGRFISLHTGDPGNTGANEVSATGTAYARQAASFGNSGGNPTSAKNLALIQFAAATASWGTITYFGVWDAVTSGNFLGFGAVTVPKTVSIDDVVRYLADTLEVTMN